MVIKIFDWGLYDDFIHIVTFKKIFYYRKVLCVCLGDGVKCVGFICVLFESV